MKIKWLRPGTIYAVLPILAGGSIVQGQTNSGKQPEDRKVKEIISNMTLDQKAQLVIGTGMFFDLPDSIKAKMPKGFGGAVDSKDPVYNEMINKIHKYLPGAAGVSSEFPELGIASQVLTDGPAGLRIQPKRKGEEKTYYLKLFPSETDPETEQSQLILSGLQTFGVQAYAWMNLQNKTGKSSVYMYHFERAVPYREDQKPFGAFHTGEVPYAYNNLHTSNRPWQQTDYQLAETMSTFWVNFAANGNPNGTGLPKWTACSSKNPTVMTLAEKVGISDLQNKKGLEFLEQFYLSKIK